MGGASVRLLLRYDRSAVFAGELWRLLSGHLVHGSLRHLALNLAGASLIAALFGRDYSAAHWLSILLVSALAIDVAFVFYEPQLQWYVGLSGVLHGAIAAGLVAWWRYENRYLTTAVAMLLLAKLVWEQQYGALTLAGDMPVVVDAHVYGCIGGLWAASIIWLQQRYWRGGERSL